MNLLSSQLLRSSGGPQPSVSLSVVVPVFNEQAVLAEFHRRLRRVLEGIGLPYEVVYVDDGSDDDTPRLLQQLHASHPEIAYARLTRNFGKEAAMSAGLELARGRAVVVIDADLQDPPELIPLMVEAWQDGFDVVNMRRRNQDGVSWLRRGIARAFYRFIERTSEVSIPRDVGDFRLLSRRAVDALNRLPERGRFMKGLFAWIGFPQTTLDFDRDARAAGTTKWPFLKLVGLAVEGVTSFSAMPLRLATWLGLATAGGAFAYAFYFFVKALIVGDSVHGFPTLIVSLLFLGGLQLLCIGVLGEYVARIFTEAKHRPIFLIDVFLPAKAPKMDSHIANSPC